MTEPFDPDRMSADDVDPTDPDAILDWLDHPNTVALHDDLSRDFLNQPPAVQQARLQELIDEQERQLAELDAALATSDDHARPGLELLRDRKRQTIEAARLRMLELDG